ncbi:MAG: hypothetical protein IPH04_15595 [Saprospirales bacterium]|nr:hypothetical protein [Saprospirales bacterium]
MKKLFLWVSLLLLLAEMALSQERLLVTNSCDYSGEISPVEDLYGFASDTEADDAMKQIMKYTGLPSNFTIKAANVPNAAAILYEDKRFILYNQYFMIRIKDETKTDWAALSILAHEIGHHLSGHTLDTQGSRPDKELEADRFSGFILYKMGASIEEARTAMDALASETGTPTHPPKSARLAAVTNGWLEAENQNEAVKPIRSEPTEKPVSPVITVVPKSPADPQRASAVFRRVWVEQGVEEGGVKGLRVHASFILSHLPGEKCKAVAWFYDEASGEPLEDFNGLYSTSTGDVSAGVDFVPSDVSSDFTDFSLFLPYDELHLEEGNYRIKFQIGLFHQMQGDRMQQVGPVSAFSSFEYKFGKPIPSALFQKLWVDFDVYEGIRKGLRIHLQFSVRNGKDKPCRAVAWFYSDSGLPLQDYNGKYNSVDGKVSVGADFLPRYDSADYSDLTLFMPYDELHLSSGHHSLKLDAGLFFENEGALKQLGEGFEARTFSFSK